MSQTSLLPDDNGFGDDAATRALFVQGDIHIRKFLVNSTPRVFIISGPSGVGKDTVLEQLRYVYPDARYVVTATSRPMRPGEIDGVHYLFLDRADFEQQIANGDFIESALVYDNLYGVPRRPIEEGLANGQHVIIKVDVKGAATLRELIPNTLSIFLLPESMQALLARLRDRKTEDPEALRRRFRTASEELDRIEEFDFAIFNQAGKLEEALRGIRNVVETEQSRIHAPAIRLPDRQVTS